MELATSLRGWIYSLTQHRVTKITKEIAVRLGRKGGNTKKWKTKQNEKKLKEFIDELSDLYKHIRHDKDDSK